MRRFRTPGLVPPGGRQFFFRVPETDTNFQNAFFDDLVIEVRKHYLGNRMTPPGNLAEVIEDYICQECPESFSVERR